MYHYPYTIPIWSLSLLGGFNHSEKYDFVSWDDDIPYMESPKIPWFQSTNQYDNHQYYPTITLLSTINHC